MKPWEQVVRNVGVWLSVYPTVCLISYALQWAEWEMPTFVKVFFSTIVSVPLISYVAIPAIERRIAAMQGESQADLKRRQAEDADGGGT